ncbi:MAG: hypothetical protein GY757_33160 [bacterium]|nr:hypothetical protein [bacterium]
MKKKIFFCLILIFILAGISCKQDVESTEFDKDAWTKAFKKKETLDTKPEKVAELEEVYKSPTLSYFGDEGFYVVSGNLSGGDSLSINRYSNQDYCLKMKFGRRGEGPGEFRFIQAFRVFPDFLFINSPGKNSYFSKDGRLIKEVKCPPRLSPCVPVGDNFLSSEYSAMPDEDDPYTEYKKILVNSEFKKIETIVHKKIKASYRTNSTTNKREVWIFPEYCKTAVYKGKIYVGFSSLDGFFFTVFDSTGKKLYKINRPYERREVPDLVKEAIRERTHKMAGTNLAFSIRFNKYYPSFCDFRVTDDKIYIFSYPGIQTQRIITMDLKGKLLDVNLVPFDLTVLKQESFQILFRNVIHNGKIHFFRDNHETSKWELWNLKICK